MKRSKSKFMKWFSFSRHQRRFGANKNIITTNFEQQKHIIINSNTKIKYTHGSVTDLKTHLQQLRSEFIGSAELCYTHAKIIVLIRREYQEKKYFQLFEQLWNDHQSFLLKNLNTRWLVSATDTFTDYSTDDAVKAMAIGCSCFINTIKISESERYINDAQKLTKINENKKHILDKNNRVSLFDGISVFKIGTDDTLRNMRWRLDKIAKDNIAGKIWLELFKRVQQHDTVYQRMKNQHTRKSTQWW